MAGGGVRVRRLLLSNGECVGSAGRPEGRSYLEPQAWAVMSGVGDAGGRGRQAMDAARELLNTPRGLMICAPPYTGLPTPNDPLKGNSPGLGENGGIFCHANTWAIIAECLLGRGEYAYEYFRGQCYRTIVRNAPERSEVRSSVFSRVDRRSVRRP